VLIAGFLKKIDLNLLLSIISAFFC
jgi:hypothetical protein